MISSKDAFLAGLNLSYTATYFDQVLFAAKLSNLNTESSKLHAEKMIANIQKMGPNFAARLKQVEQTRIEANFTQMDIPALPPEYYPWAQRSHQAFLEFWPLDDPQGALFVVGNAIGALRNGLILSNLALDFQRNFNIDVDVTLKKVPERSQLAIEKWDRAIKILEHLPNLDSQTVQCSQVLRQLHTGLKEHLQSTLQLLERAKGNSEVAQATIAFNHKLIQILANIEPEITTIFQSAKS